MVDRSKLLCGSASLEPEVTVSPNVPGFIPTGNSVVLSPAAHPSERTLDTLSLVTEEGTAKMRPYQSAKSSREREIVINDGSRETSKDGSGKREFKDEMAAGAE
ncbi:hypothetical protein ALC57_11335 [Trachymyrmex cornetzi]|uniref:Uncharacterized protein n=1 Tax=Trachymyrmex cornetzi TaxID=471704 RepID=A0A195DU83_9HYME|nr:hypothetical protein ALC57_11335 [Trachymyrmex cornetzi]